MQSLRTTWNLLLSLELFLWRTTFGALVGRLRACVHIATNSTNPSGAVWGIFVGFGSFSFLHVLFLYRFDFKQQFYCLYHKDSFLLEPLQIQNKNATQSGWHVKEAIRCRNWWWYELVWDSTPLDISRRASPPPQRIPPLELHLVQKCSEQPARFHQ